MMLFSKDEISNLPTQAKEVFDVSGAGDTVIAGVSLALSSGATLFDAAELANHAAGIAVGKAGTATVSAQELTSIYESESKKLKTLDELKKIRHDLKVKVKKVVFTNGCFDILHSGHISLLSQAKEFGDVLIVGLNSDESVKSLKGNQRPIISEIERSDLLSALECVDYVTIFHEKDPCKVISELEPDIHVKGGDYNPKDYTTMPEAKIINEYGGEIKIVKIINGKSTTGIIERVLSAQK